MDSFKELTLNIAHYLVIADTTPKDVNELLERKCPECGKGIGELINAAVGTTGENMKLRRFVVFQPVEGAFVHTYIHAGGRMGVMIHLAVEKYGPEAEELAHNLAMHVAAANPLTIQIKELTPEILAKERAVYLAKIKESGKPENLWEKIVDNQMKKFYTEVVLLEQPYVKEPAKNIEALLKSYGATTGKAEIKAFVRFQLGEEIEGEKADD
jgi:elongation factor Ts